MYFLSAPHVFGDLQERVDKRLWTKLCRLQQKFIRKAEAAAEKSASSKGQGRGRGKRCDKATNLQELGDKFLHAAAKLLDDNMNYFKKSGACLKCGQTCCWTPRQGDSETAAVPEAIWVEAAGNTCTPWSSRGSRKGWLDEESSVALVWAWSLKAGGQSPDAVINENMPAWPAEKLWHLVWPSCVVMSETFSPCDMGVPCNRVRRYTVVLPQQGRLKTMAPLSEKCHDCKSVLASGDRVRLDAHLAQMDGFQDVSVDITQNVGHTAAVSVLPTIIKNSKLFCARAGRIFLPKETFCCNGVPEVFSAGRSCALEASRAFRRGCRGDSNQGSQGHGGQWHGPMSSGRSAGAGPGVGVPPVM